MKRHSFTIVVIAMALGWPSTAEARSSYCSPTGDYCKYTYKQHGRQRIELRTAALYGPTPLYRLCVDPPRGAETCRTFKLRRWRGKVRRSKVTWSAHFPVAGRGTYRVRWDHAGLTYGPPLTFRR